MLIDRARRIALFRLCIAASDDAAETFLLRVADRLGMAAPPRGGDPILAFRMSAGTFRGWKVEIEMRAPAFPPSGPGWMRIALKGDGVLMVTHRSSSEAEKRLAGEVKGALEELGYAWESFPRASHALDGDGPDGGVMDAVKGIAARMIDSVKSDWPE